MSPLARLVTLCSICVAANLPQRAAAIDNYIIDPQHTSVIFSVAHSGLSYTYGMFREASGVYSIDKTNPANSKFRFVIKTDSLFTNNQKRDDHLRTADFFNVQQFPEIVFETTKCTPTNTQDGGVLYQLTGILTMHGVSKQVSIPLRMLGEGLGAYGDARTGFLCQLELKRSEFNMASLIDKKLVGDAIGITVSFEGSLQDPNAVTRSP